MTTTFKVALTALVSLDYQNRPSFLAHLPFHPTAQQLFDCPELGKLSANRIRELQEEQIVIYDKQTKYRLDETVLEIDVNTLKENIAEICEALNLRPASDLSDISSELKSIRLTSAEVKNRMD